MKALWFALPLLALTQLLPMPAHSQPTIAVGSSFGLNIGTCSVDPINPNVTKSGRTGLVFGSSLEVGFGSMFCVVTDFQYAQKGYQISGPGGKASYNFNYFDIPVLFKVKFLRGKIHPYAFIGPDIGILLTATETLELTGQNAEDKDIKDYFGTDFSLHFGGGAEFNIARKISLTGDVRYMLGLKSIYSYEGDDTKIKPSGFVISVGALFYI